MPAPALTASTTPVRRWFSRWWLPMCGIAFILGSDFKLRTRPPGQALSGGIDSTVAIELGLYGAVAAFLVLAHFKVPRVRRVPPPLYFLCCFVGLVVLSLASTPYVQYALVRAIEVCIVLGVVLVAYGKATRGDFHRFAHAYLGLIALAVAYGVAIPSTPINNNQAGRFTWLAVHPTVSGAMAGLATVIAAGYIVLGTRQRPGPRWSRMVYLILLVAVGGGLLGTQTRGAILAAFAGILAVVTTALSGRKLLDALAGMLVLAVGGALAASGQIATYFERGQDSSKLTSLSDRTELWDLALKAFEQKPLFGHGITASRGIFYSEIGLGGGHNAAINVLVELGLVGMIVWLAVVVSLLVGVWRLPKVGLRGMRSDRSMIFGVMTFLLVDSIVYEGPGAVANVGSTWLFMCVAWYLVAFKFVRRYGDIDDAGEPSAADTPVRGVRN